MSGESTQPQTSSHEALYSDEILDPRDTFIPGDRPLQNKSAVLELLGILQRQLGSEISSEELWSTLRSLQISGLGKQDLIIHLERARAINDVTTAEQRFEENARLALEIVHGPHRELSNPSLALIWSEDGPGPGGESAAINSDPYAHILQGFASLTENWDSYGAKPQDPQTLESFTLFLEAIRTGTAQIYPTHNGGAQVEVHEQGWDIELEFDPAGENKDDMDGFAARLLLLRSPRAENRATTEAQAAMGATNKGLSEDAVAARNKAAQDIINGLPKLIL